MARCGCATIRSAFICLILAASGCTTIQNSLDIVEARHELLRERVALKSAEHDARQQQKLAAMQQQLQQLQGLDSTTTETKLAMDFNQSIDFDDIELDVDEMKRVIAMAEARARAETLRRQRRAQLLRDQQKALEAAGAINVSTAEMSQDIAQAGYQQAIPGSSAADDVVAIDEFGNLLEFEPEPAPRVALFEVPFSMRVRLSMGVDNPRVEASSVRRNRATSATVAGDEVNADGSVPCVGCGRRGCRVRNCALGSSFGWPAASLGTPTGLVSAVPAPNLAPMSGVQVAEPQSTEPKFKWRKPKLKKTAAKTESSQLSSQSKSSGWSPWPSSNAQPIAAAQPAQSTPIVNSAPAAGSSATPPKVNSSSAFSARPTSSNVPAQVAGSGTPKPKLFKPEAKKAEFARSDSPAGSNAWSAWPTTHSYRNLAAQPAVGNANSNTNVESPREWTKPKGNTNAVANSDWPTPNSNTNSSAQSAWTSPNSNPRVATNFDWPTATGSNQSASASSASAVNSDNPKALSGWRWE